MEHRESPHLVACAGTKHHISHCDYSVLVPSRQQIDETGGKEVDQWSHAASILAAEQRQNASEKQSVLFYWVTPFCMLRETESAVPVLFQGSLPPHHPLHRTVCKPHNPAPAVGFKKSSEFARQFFIDYTRPIFSLSFLQQNTQSIWKNHLHPGRCRAV